MLVVCNGGHRTGSTVAYNMVRLLVERQGGCAMGGRAVTADLLDRHASDGRWWVVKKHWTVAKQERKGVRFVHTVRNALDTAASLMRKPIPMDEPQILECVVRQRAFTEAIRRRKDTLVLEHAAMYKRAEACVGEIADFLGFDLEECEPRRIGEMLSVQAVEGIRKSIPPGQADMLSQWRHGHISATMGRPGAWKTVLRPAFAQRLRTELGESNGRMDMQPQ